MPNAITSTGIVTATQAELISKYTTAMKLIYGPDINLDPDTPDGQQMMITIQATLDNLDFVKQVFNSFDPDKAFGKVLDMRGALNGVIRKGGTYTVTNVTLVLTQNLNLYGLDQSVQDVYTVADAQGNQWELLLTDLGLAPGTHVLPFRAKNPGAVLTTPNTITIPVTIVLGVQSINNPTTYTTLGINEESDFIYKIRRQKSVSIADQGYLAGLYAALNNVNGVLVSKVYENKTDAVNGDGQPGHSIWVIIGGSASAADIAQAIYQKRNGGCDMYGSQSYLITQVDGTPFVVQWDLISSENLFIKFDVTSLDGVVAPNVDAIRTQLALLLTPGVYEKVNINEIATLVQSIDPNVLVTNAGLGLTDSGAFSPTLQPSSKKNQFAVSSPNIIIAPMQIKPSTVKMNHGDTRQYSAYGGFGTYTYTLYSNNSGGTITPTGFYTAGATPATTDVIRVTDAHGNTADATVTVL